MADINNTQFYNFFTEPELSVKTVLELVYTAMEEKGYNPVGQIVGYILSEDPTYITNHAGARQMIARIDREELLKDMIADYLGK